MRRRHSPLGRRLVKVCGEGGAETGRQGRRGAEVGKTALLNVYIFKIYFSGNLRKKWFGRHKAAADSSGSAPVSALPVLFRAFGPAYSLSSVLWVALTVLYFARLETHLVFSHKLHLQNLNFRYIFKSAAGEPPDHLRDERRAAVEGLLLHRPHDCHHDSSHHTELPIFLPGVAI